MDGYGVRGAAALLASVITTLAVQFHRAKRNSNFAIVEAMPKVELHVHLDGALCNEALFSALGDGDLADRLPTAVTLGWDAANPLNVKAELEKCKTLGDFNCLCRCKGERSLNAMLRCFEIFTPIVRGNMQLLEENAYKFAENQSKQNVVYTEVRYSPHFLASTSSKTKTGVLNGAAKEIVAAVTRGLIRGCQEFDIVINQILCCINWRPEWADETVDLAYEFSQGGGKCCVVGVDVAAGEEHFDEVNFPQLHGPHLKAISRAKRLGLNVTLHAGEDTGPENIFKAVDVYKATRVGHGYRAADDEGVLKNMAQRRIHFEVCPTSSFETGGWQGNEGEWHAHPLINMLKSGLSVSINSDDPTVFATSLTDEICIANVGMRVTVEKILAIMVGSMEASFATQETKVKVIENVLKRFRVANH
ncbi:hypothetical protein TrVE_jg3076 [Triparma verrucosa]|uniref:Adenosine deaminase n=1 Tax=Triparma verrucosa TaxID=1606542 RepID=A0A9W7B0R3_9STRA|nr:hypothetical protein TrVE_jg3076 [Triparma verrucosa]